MFRPKGNQTGVVGKVGEFIGVLAGLYQRFEPILTALNPLKMGFEILMGVLNGGLAGGFFQEMRPRRRHFRAAQGVDL